MARVLPAADYHMKLIGMALADCVDGVPSYLQGVRVLPDGTLPPMNVLRWWFAMRYDSVEVSALVEQEGLAERIGWQPVVYTQVGLLIFGRRPLFTVA